MSDSAPVDVARRFVDAVAWGEHTTVWEMLSSQARVAVLEVAERRGLDALRAARLREGTAGHGERDEFLADLVHGLQFELAGLDVDAVGYSTRGSGATVPGSVLVDLLADLPAELGPPVSVATVELVEEAGRCAVVRLDGRR